MSSTIGNTLRLTLFGRSHGPVIGMTLGWHPRRKGPVPGGRCRRFWTGRGGRAAALSPRPGGRRMFPDFSRA